MSSVASALWFVVWRWRLVHWCRTKELKVACDVMVRSRNQNPAQCEPSFIFLSCHSHPFPPSYSKTSPSKFSAHLLSFSLLRKTATMTRRRSTMETERRTKRTADASVTICDDGHRCENWSLCVEKEGDEGVSLFFFSILVCFIIGIAHRAHPSHPFHIRPSTPPRMYAHPSHHIISPYVLLSATAYLELLLRLRCCHGSRNL